MSCGYNYTPVTSVSTILYFFKMEVVMGAVLSRWLQGKFIMTYEYSSLEYYSLKFIMKKVVICLLAEMPTTLSLSTKKHNEEYL